MFFRSLGYIRYSIAIVAIGLCMSAQAEIVDPEATHWQALQYAQKGQHNLAIEMLLWLHQSDATRPEYVYDAITVLGWAGRDREALTYFDQLDFEQVPNYVLETAAKSMRNTGRFIEAEQLYHQVIRNSPQRMQAHEGIVLSLADRKLTREADTYLQQHPHLTKQFHIRCYIQQQSDSIGWLDCAQRWHKAEPDNMEAARQVIIASHTLGAYQQALNISAEIPGLLTEKQIWQLKLDKLAQEIRWLDIHTQSSAEHGGQLLSELEQAFNQTKNTPTLIGVHKRARADLVSLLQRLGKHEQALQLAQSYSNRDPLPDYLYTSLAYAWLNTNQPKRAEQYFRIALHKQIDDIAARDGLYTALLAQNKLDEAQQLVDEASKTEPAWLAVKNRSYFRRNPRKLDMLIRGAMVRAYQNEIDTGIQSLSTLRDAAPANPVLRNELSILYRWNGEHRLACQEAFAAYSLDPTYLASLEQQYYCLHEQWLYQNADHVLSIYLRKSDDYASTIPLLRHNRIAHNPTYYASYTSRNSSGQQDNSAEKQWSGTLLSARVANYWRGIYEFQRANSHFNLATSNHNWIFNRHLIGVNLQRNRNESQLQLGFSDLPENRIGLRLLHLRRLTDHWNIRGDIDTDSSDTPIRARANSYSGISYALSGGWQNLSNIEVNSGWSQLFVSDSNTISNFNTTGRFQLLSRRSQTLHATAGLYLSSNSLTETSYFSPRSNASFEIGALYTHRFNISDSQQLDWQTTLSSGMAKQHGYDTNGLLAMGSAAEWHLRDVFSSRLSLAYSRPSYDGNLENTWVVAIDLTGHLP